MSGYRQDGYLKLGGFGYAREIKPGVKALTLCGSPEYIAPEIVLSHGHSRAVDYWALGVLIYEMTVGTTPFCDTDPRTLHSAVQNLFLIM